jgi:16S rRNA (guanine527-N7)-methyltransferase
MTPGAALDRGLAEMALRLAPEMRGRLLDYVALLVKWNRTYNLTAIRDPLAMVAHHLLDSLAVLPHLPLAAGRGRLADAGSGAGLPGIPLAVARPQWQIVLAESSQKKAAFLRQAAIELKLANVQVHEGRVESWRPQQLFDVVISRAFAALEDFVKACAHLLAPTGVLAAMRGVAPAQLAQGCSLVPLSVPLLEAERHLVLCPASSLS